MHDDHRQDDGAELTLDPVRSLDRPHAFYAMILDMQRARSTWLVGMALATKFPDEEDWEALLQDPDFLDTAESLAEVVDDVRTLSAMGGVTPEAVAEAVSQHHGRAIEAVEPLSERLGVDPNDLLSFLLA